jgi:hypothetical protein
VQSELHFGRLPWRTALISGWGLSEQGRKLSKRDLDSAGRFALFVPTLTEKFLLCVAMTPQVANFYSSGR